MPISETFLRRVREIAGAANVLTEREDLIPYSFDGTAALQQMPGAVVLPRTAGEVAGLLQCANETGIAVVTRGSGTGLSGGSLPSKDCLVLCLVRMNRILEVDPANLTLSAEAGVTTVEIA